MGATSGMGHEIAMHYIQKGCIVGVAGRRAHKLDELCAIAPQRVFSQIIDVTKEPDLEGLHLLIEKLGGMDIYVHSSGMGTRNLELDPDAEMKTIYTNGVGFVRFITAAYRYLERNGGGTLAAISSVAGTKGLGASPAYSATKRMQNTYLEALSQRSHTNRDGVRVVDIRPGFVDTAFLRDHNYPMLMSPEYAVKRIIKAIERAKRVAIIDWRYAILVVAWRAIPSCVWVRLRSIK